jgi:hypothetical protein
MLSITFYHVAHIVGLVFVFIGFGALLSTEGAKSAMKWHGAGLLISFITGFAMLSKLGLMKDLPVWVFVKMGLWLVLGFLPVLAKRRVLSPTVVVLIALIIGGCLAFLGYPGGGRTIPWLQ